MKNFIISVLILAAAVFAWKKDMQIDLGEAFGYFKNPYNASFYNSFLKTPDYRASYDRAAENGYYRYQYYPPQQNP